jgi:WhiB family redox-sensing transcriptional regulator
MNWDNEASCQSVDPEVFFPERQGEAATMAKTICRGCPVRMQCLEFALSARLDYGVWGGMTEHERRSLRRSRQRKARREAVAAESATGTPMQALDLQASDRQPLGASVA